MKFGVYLANFGGEASPQVYADLANLAEESGWDGFFLWDHMLYSKSQKTHMFDPWICLAAVASATQRIRFGTTVTPVARRRPTQLAHTTASLDILSGGRLIFDAGLGDPPDADFSFLGMIPIHGNAPPSSMKAWRSSMGCGVANHFLVRASTSRSRNPGSYPHPSRGPASRSGSVVYSQIQNRLFERPIGMG